MLRLSTTDGAVVAANFRAKNPVRLFGGYLVFVGIGLASVWLVVWATHVFGGKPTLVEPEAFQVVAALDLSLIVTVQVFAGVLPWRQLAWGYAVGTITILLGRRDAGLIGFALAILIWNDRNQSMFWESRSGPGPDFSYSDAQN